MNDALTMQVFHLVKRLRDYGIEEVVISPGSRSTPLAIACELHERITTYIHPDERSAAFFALGLIKATQKPVAILCTSGTAASNYVPAVTEAYISHLPLVVLTSDRPHELRNVGAPQAINQVNMFQNFVMYERDFPIADGSDGTITFIEHVMQQAQTHFNGPMRGPVHFNIPFREPLMPDVTRTDLLSYTPVPNVLYQKSFNIDVMRPVLNLKRGLIIAGDSQQEDLTQLLVFSTIHNIPIIADPLSQLRDSKHPNVITTGDSVFKALEHIHAGYVIRVSHAVVSKPINTWLAQTDIPQVLVQSRATPDTFPKVPDLYIEMTANDFFRQLADEKPADNKEWLKYWQTMNDLIINQIHQHTQTVTDEGRAIYEIFKQIEDDAVIFLGNSMPIRDCDTFFTQFSGKPFCNRGANGIDGVVSTAMGMAVHKKVTLIIGDISFYHDLNGLIMKKLENLDINIVVFNNNGGGIFSYLPQKENDTYFERLFGTPLNLNFKYAAQLYDFNYYMFNVFDDFKLPDSGANIIEVITDRNENLLAHQQLIRTLKDKLNAEL